MCNYSSNFEFSSASKAEIASSYRSVSFSAQSYGHFTLFYRANA